MMENPGICPPRHRGNLTTEFYTLSPNPFSLLRLMKSARNGNEPIFNISSYAKKQWCSIAEKVSFHGLMLDQV